MSDTKHKTECPTRLQWRVLATLRDGPTKYLSHFHGNYRVGQRSGRSSIRTALSVKKRGWVLFDKDASHYALSEAGRVALAVGDRRYLQSEIDYARRAL